MDYCKYCGLKIWGNDLVNHLNDEVWHVGCDKYTVRGISEEDEINKPSHYHKGGIDVIGFAELHYSKEELKGFYRINIIKYVDRYDTKGGLKSLEKAEFYLKKLMELETNG
jgi:hypothetical protein